MSKQSYTPGPFRRSSGVWWIGAQTITEVRSKAVLALDEAQRSKRLFSPLSFPGDFGRRAAIAKALGE